MVVVSRPSTGRSNRLAKSGSRNTSRLAGTLVRISAAVLFSGSVRWNVARARADPLADEERDLVERHLGGGQPDDGLAGGRDLRPGPPQPVGPQPAVADQPALVVGRQREVAADVGVELSPATP